jgi:FkbM family methyltransferase
MLLCLTCEFCIKLNLKPRPSAIMPIFHSLELYLRAAVAQRSGNLRGLPLIPKRLFSSAPYHRTAYNQFVTWIDRLRLGAVTMAIDVGANHGDFSQAVSTLYPRAKILLVEPLPTLHRELERRCRERPGCWQLAKCALGGAPGEATLYVDPSHDAVGSLAGFSEEYLRTNPGTAAKVNHLCTVKTLDILCDELGITAIDLLKIDVEGFEFEVMKGAARMLSATRAVVVELSLIRRSGDADAIERMLATLRTAGFALLELFPSFYVPERPWQPAEFNLLARRP